MNTKKNWKEIKLGEVVNTQYGFTESATKYDTGIKFVRITDIVPDFIDWDSIPFCEINASEVEKYLLKMGDMVVARTGTVGYAKQIKNNPPKSVFASYLVRMTLKDKYKEDIDSYFLGILVCSKIYKNYIAIIAGGSTQPTANANDLISFKFLLPPLPTQTRIAAILSGYDNLIENNLQRIGILEQIAQALYKKWFVQFTINKQTLPINPQTGIPEGWEVKALREVITFYIGGGWGNDETDEQFNSAAYVIRGTDIPKIRKAETNKDVYRFHKASNLKSRKLMVGDIVFEVAGGSEGQPLGRSCIITDEILKQYGDAVICASFCKQIRTEIVSPYFLYLFINSLYENNAMQGFEVQSTGISNFQFEDFIDNQFIIIPSKVLMNNFHDFISNIFQEIGVLGNQNTLLRNMRNALLPRLMRGDMLT